MLVKVKSTGEVVKAKRFKNMTTEEKFNSIIEDDISLFDGEEIFIEPTDCEVGVWRYMFDCEVEILEEEINE